MTMLFSLGLFVEGEEQEVARRAGGDTRRGLTARADKDERKTNRPPPPVPLLLLPPPPPPLEACPLKIDKVAFCVALLEQQCGDTHSPVSAAVRSRPFAEPVGLSHHALQYNRAIIFQLRGASISSRAHELTCKEASCSPVDVY